MAMVKFGMLVLSRGINLNNDAPTHTFFVTTLNHAHIKASSGNKLTLQPLIKSR